MFTVRYKIYLSLLIFLSVLRPAVVTASPVELEILTPTAVVGEELSFAIRFSLEEEKEPVDVSNVKYRGVAIPYQVSNRSNSSFRMVVNGKTITSSSEIERGYIFSLPAARVGKLELPRFSVSKGGKTYRVGPISFEVLDKPTSENLKFLVSIDKPQPYYYPSQIIDLKYQILYREFPGSPTIESISMPILKNMNFQLIPAKQTNFKLPVNGGETAINARQSKTNYQGKTFNLLEFHLKFRLMQPGDFNLANHIKLIVATGRKIRQRSFLFGPSYVNETKPLYADTLPFKIRVLKLPEQNVPASFNGAIGEFRIQVTPSSDTAIRVGDPITLLIEISGRGTWEFVKCPPIYKANNITDYFIVSREPVIGEVNEAGSSKSFSVRLRVKSKTVKEIPAIAFTYFNLTSRKYVTVHSAPVPITVFAAGPNALITDFNDHEEQREPGTTAGEQSKANISTTSQANNNGTMPPATLELKPELPPLVEIADNVPYTMTMKNHAPPYGNLWFAIMPMTGIFFLYLFRLFQGRTISKEKAARYKSSKAFKNLLSDLGKLSPDGRNITAFSGILGRRLHKFFEERFLCTVPHLDDESIQPLLDQGKISPATAQQLLDIVERIDQHRYAIDSNDLDKPNQLLTATIEALKQCDL